MPATSTDRLYGLTTSVAVKPPCIVVSTTPIILSGLQTIGSTTVAQDDRVLVTGQANSVDNGIYTASTSAWQRATDFDGVRDAVSGTIVIVHDSNGVLNTWKLETLDPVVIGTSGLVFSPVLTGSSDTLAYTPLGIGAITTNVQAALNWNQVNVYQFMTAVQIADAKAYTYSLDMTTAFAAAVAALVVLGEGDLIVPKGGYLLDGVAGSDTYKNGILLPDTNGDFSTGQGIRLVGEGVDTVLKAGSADMIVLRHSRLYSGGENFRIDGAGLSNVIGVGLVPESLTQTTTAVSQSYGVYRNVKVENCTEGMLLQPGPTVSGTDSGAFYHRFYDMDFNLNTRHVWMKKDVTGALNRTTRTSFYGCTFLRGNTGVQIDGGTEIDFFAPNFELIATGTSPSATPTAFNYADTNPANIRIFGGYAEACTISVTSVSPEQVSLFGFAHTGAAAASEFLMGRFAAGYLNVPKITNTPVVISAGNPSFASFVIDPDGDGSKTIAVFTNDTERMRWFNGTTTIKGSAGDFVFDPTGTTLSFTAASNNVISQPSGATQINVCDNQYWRNVAGTDVIRLDLIGTTSLFPTTDNITVLGQAGLRWTAVWAANGTIQTSDPRTKKDVVDSPLGLDFINALRPVAYKFKVGGNKVIGNKIITPEVLDEEGNVISMAMTEPVTEAIPGKRQHFGFLTTDVKKAAGNVDFGGYIKVDPSDPESEEALRYDEFIAPLVLAVQQLSAEVAALKKAKK
jgi:hypothetical protein